MAHLRKFVLWQAIHRENLIAFIDANWEAFAATKHPLQVVVSRYFSNRSLEQQSLMWVWLQQLEREGWVGGRRYSADLWHEHLKRELLPERNARGDEKWRVLPSGERLLAMSTTRLNTAEMSAYMEAMSAFASSIGVTLRTLADG